MFRNHFNYNQFKIRYEYSDKPSQTIPDQTMSVKEILSRYSRGLPLEGNKTPIYNGEEIIPDLRRMDLSEIQEMQQENQRYITEETEKIETEQREKKRKKKYEEIETELREKIKKENESHAPAPSAG